MGISVIRRAREGRRSGDARWARRGIVVGALTLSAGLLAGVSGASSPSVDVAFTPLTPAKVVLSGTIGGNATKQVVVSGGTTTVPTSATTLQMTVTAKGAQAGSLSFYPTGNPAGTSGQTVSWPAGGTGTATITTDIGQKNSVAFKNSSPATATVKATVTGWSNEVESDDISSLGGTTGQVLTDTGAGAAWQAPQLPAAYFSRDGSYLALPTSQITVASLSVPAGTYQVHAELTGYIDGATGYFVCSLVGPGGGVAGVRYGNVDNTAIYNTTMGIDALMQTGGGTITVKCGLASGAVRVYERTIMATRVGTTAGPIVTQAPRAVHPSRQPGR